MPGAHENLEDNHRELIAALRDIERAQERNTDAVLRVTDELRRRPTRQ
tara:strand:+ start:1012 stop:1155 length:144 start_codon:yes stop_codon:yes gene_type:complete